MVALSPVRLLELLELGSYADGPKYGLRCLVNEPLWIPALAVLVFREPRAGDLELVGEPPALDPAGIEERKDRPKVRDALLFDGGIDWHRVPSVS